MTPDPNGQDGRPATSGQVRGNEGPKRLSRCGEGIRKTVSQPVVPDEYRFRLPPGKRETSPLSRPTNGDRSVPEVAPRTSRWSRPTSQGINAPYRIDPYGTQNSNQIEGFNLPVCSAPSTHFCNFQIAERADDFVDGEVDRSTTSIADEEILRRLQLMEVRKVSAMNCSCFGFAVDKRFGWSFDAASVFGGGDVQATGPVTRLGSGCQYKGCDIGMVISGIPRCGSIQEVEIPRSPSVCA